MKGVNKLRKIILFFKIDFMRKYNHHYYCIAYTACYEFLQENNNITMFFV